MSISDTIKEKIEEKFSPLYFKLVNESHQHSGPRTESHFKIILSSQDFEGKHLLKRHQAVHTCLQEEFKIIHALSLKLYSPKEWEEEKKNIPKSPPCSSK